MTDCPANSSATAACCRFGIRSIAILSLLSLTGCGSTRPAKTQAELLQARDARQEQFHQLTGDLMQRLVARVKGEYDDYSAGKTSQPPVVDLLIISGGGKGDALAWDMAARALTPDQIDELHKLIDQWRADNPDQYYISHIRFAEFAAARRITRTSPQAKQPSNLFSLLYLDPMANLDPVAQEMQGYRELAERLTFLMERTPVLIGWETELVARRTIAAPQINDLVNNTGKLANAAAQFAAASAKYPQDLSAERQAAITQIADEVTKQRQAFDQDLDQQSGRLGKLVAQANDLVTQVDKAGASINAATTATVLTSEQASRRTLNHAFKLGLTLILVVLLGVPLAMLSYRWTCKRFGFVGSKR